MKNALFLAAAVMSLSLAVGCTPSPEKVCDHMFELLESEMKGKDMPKSSDEDKKKSKDKCVSDLAAEKEKDGDSYKCGSKCIVAAKNFEEIMKCEETCPGLKKKKSSSKDSEDKADKAADKGDEKKKKKDE